MVKKINLKVIVISILISLISFIIGCDSFFKEDKQFSALKTEAVYSSFGYPGFSKDAINVIQTDEEGRMIFEFYGQNFANYYGITHVLVCQYIDYEKDLVYFYPQGNFKIRLINEETTNEQIEQLKIANDWGKKLDLSKCISRKIGEYKKINKEQEILSVFENLNIGIEIKYSKIILCDTDKNGLKLYAVKLAENEQNYKIFAFMLKNNEYTNYDIVEVNDWYYIDVIDDFKEKHNWTYD